MVIKVNPVQPILCHNVKQFKGLAQAKIIKKIGDFILAS